MACYLFTFHAFGSWMPDRPEGYVVRHKGLQTTDEKTAAQYRRQQQQASVVFDASTQQLMIDELLACADRQGFRLHAVATDPSHIHVLVSWSDKREAVKLRTAIKKSLTWRLNESVGKRKWFSSNASQRPVFDRAHFDHLVGTYLPDHRGLFWREASA